MWCVLFRGRRAGGGAVSRSRSWARRARCGRASRRGAMVLGRRRRSRSGGSRCPPWGSSPALRRAPYTNEVVGNSATVSLGDRSLAEHGHVRPGEPSAAVSARRRTPSTATQGVDHGGLDQRVPVDRGARLPGPGTYCYRVKLGAVDLLGSDASPQVTTAAAPGSSFSFAVFGDWGAGHHRPGERDEPDRREPRELRRHRRATTSTTPAPRPSTATSRRATSSRRSSSPRSGAGRSSPRRATTGSAPTSRTCRTSRRRPPRRRPGGRYQQETYCCISTLSGPKTYPSAWYAFNWGSARFYVLEAAWADSQGGYQGDFLAHWNGPVAGCAPCGAELAWLQNDLAAHPGTLKFAFFHYPLHSDSSSQPSDTYLSGPSQARGAPREQRRRDRVQRPRAPLRAQLPADRRASRS